MKFIFQGQKMVKIIAGVLGLIWLGCGCASVAKPVPAVPTATPSGQQTKTTAAKAEEPASLKIKPPSQDQPVHITSDRLSYQEEGKVTLFSGNVRVNQEKAWLYTPYLQVKSDEGVTHARQGIKLVDPERGVTATARELDYHENLTDAVMRGHVNVWSRDDLGNQLRIQSENLEWNKKKALVVARQAVIVYYKDITATADEMNFDQERNILKLSQAQGATNHLPTILRSGDVITGREITLQVKEKIYTAHGSAKAVMLPRNQPAKKQEKH